MYKVQFDDNNTIAVELLENHIALVKEQSLHMDVQTLPDGGFSILSNHQSHQLYLETIDKKEKTATFLINNHRYQIKIQEPIDLLLAKMGINLAANKKAEAVKAPMPGLVLKVLVTEGQIIKKGDPVLILEAMKMENVFKAQADATVKVIKVSQGQAVEKGTILIELE